MSKESINEEGSYHHVRRMREELLPNEETFWSKQIVVTCRKFVLSSSPSSSSP